MNVTITIASLMKEVCEALRDKRTLVLTVLVPLVFYPGLIMMAGGLGAQQKQKVEQSELVIGVSGMDSDVAELTEISSKQKNNLQWRSYQSEREIKSLLDAGEVQAFVQASQIEEGDFESTQVEVHYLYSAQGLAAQARIKAALKTLKDNKVQAQMGRVIVLEDDVNYATLRMKAGNQFGGTAAYFLAFLAFTGCMAVAVDVAAGEKERGTLEAVLVTPAPFWKVALGKLYFIVVMGTLSVISTAGGIGLMALLASQVAPAMGIGNIDVWSVLGMIVLLLSLVFFFAVLLFSVSILARSSKEAHMKASLLMLVVAMSLVYCILPGAEVTSGVLYTPVLNVAMAIKGLWEGSLSGGQFVLVLGMMAAISMLILWYVNYRVKQDPEKVLLRQ